MFLFADERTDGEGDVEKTGKYPASTADRDRDGGGNPVHIHQISTEGTKLIRLQKTKQTLDRFISSS